MLFDGIIKAYKYDEILEEERNEPFSKGVAGPMRWLIVMALEVMIENLPSRIVPQELEI
jgi:hypothetical protein